MPATNTSRLAGGEAPGHVKPGRFVKHVDGNVRARARQHVNKALETRPVLKVRGGCLVVTVPYRAPEGHEGTDHPFPGRVMADASQLAGGRENKVIISWKQHSDRLGSNGRDLAMHLCKGHLAQKLKRFNLTHLKRAQLQVVPINKARRGGVVQQNTGEGGLLRRSDAHKAPGAAKVRGVNLQLVFEQLAFDSNRLRSWLSRRDPGGQSVEANRDRCRLYEFLLQVSLTLRL